MKIKFKPFMEKADSGKFLVNPYWLEYLLCLFYQGHFITYWEEIQDTKINLCKTIENVGYGIIGYNQIIKSLKELK